MRALRIAAVLAAAWAACLAPAGGRATADVLVVIDKASQRMSVAIDGRTRYVWPVSTGRAGYGTPSGRFRPQWMARTYFSKKYYDSPMPHSIFFYHGYAIHGTEYIHRLGGPASHGCVRLHPRNAAMLFSLVQRYGMHRTRIIIGDAIALDRPERWGAQDRGNVQFIARMTDRLMLAEQIERKEALAKMEQMRASDALRRIVERGARNGAAADEPAVAIGIEARDQAAVPVTVVRAGNAKLELMPVPRPVGRVAQPPRRQAAPKPARRPAQAEQGRRRVSSASKKPAARQAAFLAGR